MTTRRGSDDLPIAATSTEMPWQSIVLQADPDHTRESANPIEYEFSAPGGGNPLNHDGNKRVFTGYYAQRGPYVPQVVDPNGLTWNGTPINWHGDELDW